MPSTTSLPKIPEDQITPLVAELLEIIRLQIEEIQLLKDEIVRLNGKCLLLLYKRRQQRHVNPMKK